MTTPADLAAQLAEPIAGRALADLRDQLAPLVELTRAAVRTVRRIFDAVRAMLRRWAAAMAPALRQAARLAATLRRPRQPRAHAPHLAHPAPAPYARGYNRRARRRRARMRR